MEKNPMGGIVKSAIKNKRYAAIPNEICNDKSLTFGARGLLAYLLSKPENWQVNTYDLVNQSPAGEHAVRGMMNELLTEGYIIRTRTNGPTGHILWVYEVFDTPQETGSPCGDFPNMEKPSMENPNVENHPTYKDRDVKRQIEKRKSTHNARVPSILKTIGKETAWQMGTMGALDRRKVEAFAAELDADGKTADYLDNVLVKWPTFWAFRGGPPTIEQLIKHHADVVSTVANGGINNGTHRNNGTGFAASDKRAASHIAEFENIAAERERLASRKRELAERRAELERSGAPD